MSFEDCEVVAEAKVALLDESDRHAAQRQLARDAGAGHPAADDDDVVLRVLERPGTSLHRFDQSLAPSGATRAAPVITVLPGSDSRQPS
jgi:hypothetical protein